MSNSQELPAGVPELSVDDINTALASPGLERLREWAAIGPVQRAAVELFADLVGAQRAAEARSADVEALRADKALLDAIDSHCWKLDPFETAEDDYGWRVSEYHMSEPRERAVAESFNGDLRAAITAAIAASKE